MLCAVLCVKKLGVDGGRNNSFAPHQGAQNLRERKQHAVLSA